MLQRLLAMSPAEVELMGVQLSATSQKKWKYSTTPERMVLLSNLPVFKKGHSTPAALKAFAKAEVLRVKPVCAMLVGYGVIKGWHLFCSS